MVRLVIWRNRGHYDVIVMLHLNTCLFDVIGGSFEQCLVTLTVMQDLLTPGRACKIHQWLVNIFTSIQHCKYNDRKLVPDIHLMRRLSCHLLNFSPIKRCENKIWSTLPASRDPYSISEWANMMADCKFVTFSLSRWLRLLSIIDIERALVILTVSFYIMV